CVRTSSSWLAEGDHTMPFSCISSAAFIISFEWSEIRSKSTVGEQDCLEGCLSLPDVWGRVKRPAWVKIRAQDENGEFFEDSADGLIAECFMHENDHLDGKLFDSIVYEFVDAETVRKEQQTKRAKAKIK
ncbi:MAG: peptide deformylase, partial [Clostridia bacterium]|nr:peptide deformylase [Clostridia bacterium]